MEKKKNGFQNMTPERRREIARMGGKAVHAIGLGHKYTSESGTSAGIKGGKSLAAKRGSEYMAQIGRNGGKARGKKFWDQV